MAVNVVLNGVTYVVPNVGDEGNWGENLQDFFVAIPQGVLQKTGGNFTLTADANFGATYGLVSSYFKSRSSNIASAGALRLAVGDSIAWRNNANDGNLLLAVDGSNNLTFAGNVLQPAGNYITDLTGDVVATGPGSVTATIQAGVIVNSMISGSAGIDFSKLAALTSGYLIIGSSSNVPTAVQVTGDVTISDLGVTAIGSNKVTLGMMAQIDTARFLGRTTASTGNVESLTGSQATALLSNFTGDSGTGGVKGLVPAPSAGDAASSKYLKADGTWDTVTPSFANQNANTFYSGPSSGSAAAPGFRAIVSQDLTVAVTSKSTTYTATQADYLILCSTSGGGWTLTLPAAASSTGRVLVIKKTSSDVNQLTIDGDSGETIDGAATISLVMQYDSETLICDGSNWYRV